MGVFGEEGTKRNKVQIPSVARKVRKGDAQISH